MLDIELHLVVADDHSEQILIVILHALAPEVVIFQFTLELDDYTTEASEVINALPLCILPLWPIRRIAAHIVYN